MKKIFLFTIIALLSASSLKAQTTSGKNFWVTYGKWAVLSSPAALNMQIRIAAGNLQTSVTIYFTSLGVSVPFTVHAYEVYTYDLTSDQKDAVYNTITGINDYSIYISSSEEVSVYAYIGGGGSFDATNVLPITALGTEYYHCSYTNHVVSSTTHMDAYAVVATEDNTLVSHNGETPITLHAGEVYYRTATDVVDMTGSFITANNPVALFALHQSSLIPAGNPYGPSSILMQQLAPVKTWDNTFFVPVTVMEQEIVRIVASQNDTEITTLTGGTVRLGVPEAQTDITNLQAGEWVELDISDTGCYIEANNPIGVCSYMMGLMLPPVFLSLPAQAWIPGIKQTVSDALIAAFYAMNMSYITHRALICTPTDTKDNTTVSIGDAPPAPLSGGSWIDNPTADMSFYSMPLTEETASYLFSNPAGMIVLGYGVGVHPTYQSYYYLAGSSMRNLSAAFSANGVPYTEMEDHLFCVNEITFTTNISNIAEVDSMKWYKQKTSGNTPDLDYILITDIVEALR